MFVIPSRCTVFIQNSLIVDWFGLIAFTTVTEAAFVLLLFAAAAVLYSFVVSVAVVLF